MENYWKMRRVFEYKLLTVQGLLVTKKQAWSTISNVTSSQISFENRVDRFLRPFFLQA